MVICYFGAVIIVDVFVRIVMAMEWPVAIWMITDCLLKRLSNVQFSTC